jgi:DNA polymerase-3 subunit gamma/tau
MQEEDRSVMSYTALYRKFRPATFDDVKGQDHIVTTLKNQIKADRIGHAFLFCGTRGVGKTTIAKILAKAVNCESPVDGGPCGECATCRAIAAGTSMNVIEIDAASNNGVDNIREIIDEVQYSPTEGKYKVYIIDEVHMLSPGAFNALLKTLEEPPSYVIFILATTEAHKIPVTILSRCQRYDFKRATVDDVASRLRTLVDAEGVKAEEKALRCIAVKADGSFRDGISLLDQCIAFFLGQELKYDRVLDVLGAVDTATFGGLVTAIRKGDVKRCLEILEGAVMQGRELTQFVVDLTWFLRNLLVAKAEGSADNVLDIPSDYLPQFMQEVSANSEETLSRYIRILSNLSNDLRFSSQKRVLTEVALIKLCRPETEATNDSVNERMERLENEIKSGVIRLPSAAAPVKPEGPQEAEEEPAPVYTKAVPEDLQEIAKRWREIVKAFKGPVKEALSICKVSVTEDDKLLLIFADDFSYSYVAEPPETLEEVAGKIAEITGKTVDIELKLVQSKKESKGFPDLVKMFKDIPVEVV